MSTLYELRGEYELLLDMASDPDVDPEVLRDTMEGIEGQIEDKADGYAMVMKELEAQEAAIKTEVDRLNARRLAISNNIHHMKLRLQETMMATGKTKFKTTLFSFNIAKNPPSLVIDKPEEIPEEYLIPQAPKVDTAGIKAAIKAGAAFDFAHTEQSEGLRIR